MIKSRYNDSLMVACWLIDPVLNGFTSLSVKSVCLSVLPFPAHCRARNQPDGPGSTSIACGNCIPPPGCPFPA